MIDKIEKKRLNILKILSEVEEPLSSYIITKQLTNMGYDISERTVRFHLQEMDNEGYTEYVKKHGRKITKKGISELSKARIFEKVGFLSTKINRMTYNMNFNLTKKEGTIVINVSILEKKNIFKVCNLITQVFDARYSLGTLLTVFKEGEYIGNTCIPAGYTGIGTLCSVTLDGVMLSYGIPVNSRFGGILEINNKKPVRFVDIINYNGTSVDPIEIFIKSGLTNYIEATQGGNGEIGAIFKEFPQESRSKVIEIAESLVRTGLGGFMEIGWPGQNLLQIPVSEGTVGAIILAGLNPIAMIVESGIKVSSTALAGIINYKKLFSYKKLNKHISDLI